jgi:hypothetical protein
MRTKHLINTEFAILIFQEINGEMANHFANGSEQGNPKQEGSHVTSNAFQYFQGCIDHDD